MKCQKCGSGRVLPRYRKGKAPRYICNNCKKEHFPNLRQRIYNNESRNSLARL